MQLRIEVSYYKICYYSLVYYKIRHEAKTAYSQKKYYIATARTCFCIKYFMRFGEYYTCKSK